MDQADAIKKCPDVCSKANGYWNLQWRTTEPGKMSVCGCLMSSTDDVAPKVIKDDAEAANVCPKVCSDDNGRVWDNKEWKTVHDGKLSLCRCKGASPFS